MNPWVCPWVEAYWDKDISERLETFEDLQKDYPTLGTTSWTWETVVALEQAAEIHAHNCQACQDIFDALPDPTTPEYEAIDWGSFRRCEEGDHLADKAAQASLEWSWQADFPKKDDPRWKMWHAEERKWLDQLYDS